MDDRYDLHDSSDFFLKNRDSTRKEKKSRTSLSLLSNLGSAFNRPDSQTVKLHCQLNATMHARSASSGKRGRSTDRCFLPNKHDKKARFIGRGQRAMSHRNTRRNLRDRFNVADRSNVKSENGKQN